MLKNGLWKYIVVQLAAGEYPPITDRLPKYRQNHTRLDIQNIQQLEVSSCSRQSFNLDWMVQKRL